MRIKSFARPASQQRQQSLLSSDDSVSVLLYASKQNSQGIKSIQRDLITEFQGDIRLTKCTSQQTLFQVLRNSLNESVNSTICVSDRALDSLIEKLFKQNSSPKAIEKVNKFKGVLLLDQIEGIDPRNFQVRNIALLSTSVDQVKKFLKSEITNVLSFRRSGSITTLNSEDQANYEKELFKPSQSIELPKNFSKNAKKQVEVVLNDTPGVGSYEVHTNQKQNFHMGATFSTDKKKVDPKHWNANETRKGEVEWWGSPKKQNKG